MLRGMWSGSSISYEKVMWLVIKKTCKKKKQKTEPIRAYHKREDETFAKRYGSMKCDMQGGQEIGSRRGSSKGRSVENL